MTSTESPSAVVRLDGPAVLETVAGRARETLDRRKTSGRSADLIQVAELDAVLTGAVFRIARSPLFGAQAADMRLETAAERMGTAALEAVLRGLPRLPPTAPRAAVEEACRRWTLALATGAATRWLSNQGDYDDPAEAYIAGLTSCAVTESSETRGLRACDLAAHWRLGTRVETALWALRQAGRPDPSESGSLRRPDEAALRLREVLRLASTIVDALGFGPGHPGPASAHVLEHGAAAAVEEAVTLELAHAGALLRLPPGPPRDFAERLAVEELRRLAEPPGTGEIVVEKADLVDRLARVHDALVSMRMDAPIHDLLERGLGLLHEHLVFDRIVLLERDPARPQTARVRQMFCATDLVPEGGPASLEVATDAHSALSRAAEARGCVALRTMPGRADAPLLAYLGAPEAAISPVRANGSVVGLVAADLAIRNRAGTDDEVNALGIAAGMLGFVIENAALVAESRTLRALAEKDELTGIDNRRSILDHLRKEVDRARRFGKPLSIALVDVDHFKSWNDLHGHPVGDMVLKDVAQLISSSSREIDAYGRYGGEEFLVVLPETPADHAMIYSERLRAAIEGHGQELAALYTPSALSVSIGVTQLQPRGDDLYLMIARADNALYSAKKHGRNRVCVNLDSAVAAPVAPPVSRGVLDEL